MTDIFGHVQRPTLLLDEERTRRNIRRMAAKADANEVRFRPHFKTHQSAVIGQWFREEGVKAITVSSIDMATYFADYGWDDITIAFPVNVRQIDTLNALAERIDLNLLVESAETASILRERLSFPANAWLKVDTGYGRTGIHWEDFQSLAQVARSLDGRPLHLAGLLSHAGHTYKAGTPEKIVEIFEEGIARLDSARKSLGQSGGALELSVGDTPGCSLAPSFAGADEVRPGNFVFYDLAQYSFGACREEEISVAMACPVVAKHPSRSQIVIHGGAVHLSLDRIAGKDGQPVFGGVALPENSGWSPRFKGSYLKSLSQEHGIVQASAELFDRVNVGDLLVVIPIHSCLTVDLMGRYLTLDGAQVEMMARR